MSNLQAEFRQAIRILRRSPAFSLLVVCTLAIGIGANAAIFGVVRSVLLAGLPYDHPDRIVTVWGSNPERGFLRFGTSLQDFEDWRDQSTAFEALAAYVSQQSNVRVGQEPQRVRYALATPSLFDVMGVPPWRGRLPGRAENEPGNDDVIVVSHDFWRDALGGRDDAIGATVFADGRALTVIGVMPPGFFFPAPDIAFWKPFGMRPDDGGTRGARWVGSIGRLGRGVSIDAASVEMNAIAARLATEYVRTNENWSVLLEPVNETFVGAVRPALVSTWLAVGLLLLIACANAANLLLARASRRGGEWAVRAALGASRWRLVRQSLLESMILAGAGGALGLLLGRFGLTLAGAIPGSTLTPMAGGFVFDRMVVGYSILLTLATGLLAGTLPAMRRIDAALIAVSRASARTAGDGRARVRGVLVAFETALAVVLVIGAALMVRSFGALMVVDPGFDAQNRLAFRVAPSMAAYEERESAAALFARMTAQIEALPGVVRVAASNNLPLSGNRWSTEILIDGIEEAAEADRAQGNVRVVYGPYFSAVGIPLLRGREFEDSDAATSRPVAVINEATARRYFADRDPIGATVSFSPDPRAFRYTIVGVVGNEHAAALDADPGPMVYTTFAQSQFGHFLDWSMSFVVQTAADPASLADAVRTAVRQADGALPVFQLQTLEQRLSANVAQRRFIMILLTTFGVIALVLAAVGVYGVLSFTVAQRTAEIGIRMTLGASRASVLGWVIARGMVWAGIGLGAGVALALASTRLLQSQLYGTGDTDPAAFAAAIMLLGGAALCACMLPALRATRVDPAVAIRQQ